ncbi:MAG TPA: glycosyltransferase [Gemmataceae bacterium]|nr:glycosyltransferase [Gemmataceae bacterium]
MAMVAEVPGNRRSRRNHGRVVLEARVVAGSGGGPDKTILNSPRFLWSAGYETLCVYMRPPADPGFDSIRQKARTWQAPLIEIDDRGPLDVRVVSQLLTICRREKVSIWHGHDYKSNALGLLLRRFWPMHLVTTVHGWVHQTKRTPLYYWVDRVCLPRYDSVICVSPDLLEKSLACGVPANRCVLIENAIDTEEFTRSQEPALAKSKLGIPTDRFVIGAVGRLSPEKGFDLLIRAVQEMANVGIKVTLLIVGEGDARHDLERLIHELACADQVQLLGYRTDARSIYEAMDAYALSSLREGLPNVLLEAMAMEVPVVATRIAGVPRLITDKVDGLLIEPNSVENLTRALTRVVSDEQLRERLKRAGRKKIETHYSFQARMERIRAIYDQLLTP